MYFKLPGMPPLGMSSSPHSGLSSVPNLPSSPGLSATLSASVCSLRMILSLKSSSLLSMYWAPTLVIWSSNSIWLQFTLTERLMFSGMGMSTTAPTETLSADSG